MSTLFEFTCRACLERKVHTDVHSLVVPENRKIYLEVTQLWVTDKDMYTTLCDWCFTQVKNFRTFKAMCTKNDKIFRSEQEPCIEILDVAQMMDLKDKEDISTVSPDTKKDTPKDIWDCPVCINKDSDKDKDKPPEKTPIAIIDPKPDCPKCAPKLNLVEHLINHISEDCTTCHEQVVVKQFQRRPEIPQEKELSCPVCNLTIKTGYLSKHFEEEHKVMCKTFTGNSPKKYPLRSLHKDNPLIVPELEMDKGVGIEVEPEEVVDEKFLNSSCQCTCPVCKGKFTDIDEFRDHLREHIQGLKKSHCPVCLKLLNRPNILRHIWTIHDTVRFKCKHCPELFKAASELRTHTEESHLDTFRWICPLCDELMAEYAELEDHLKAKHLPMPSCPKCKAVLGLGSDPLTHIVRNHMGRFNCRQCTKGFFTALEYVEHMKTVFHIPTAKQCAIVEASINCHLCDRDFNSYDEYRTHWTAEHATSLKRKREESLEAVEEVEVNGEISEKILLRLNYKLTVPLSFPLKYTCAACKVNIETMVDAEGHKKAHGSSPNNNSYHTYHCRKCDKLYAQTWGNHADGCVGRNVEC